MYGIGHVGAEKVEETMATPALIGLASGIAMYFILAVDAGTPGEIVNAVGSVSFGALVWYLIVKHLPAIQDRHDKLMSENNQYQRERDAAVNERLSNLHDDLRDLVTEVREFRNG
jgi:hypothetical protein